LDPFEKNIDAAGRKNEVKQKMANRTSHRYNRLPLLPSDPGGVQQELVVPICRCKDTSTPA